MVSLYHQIVTVCGNTCVRHELYCVEASHQEGLRVCELRAGRPSIVASSPSKHPPRSTAPGQWRCGREGMPCRDASHTGGSGDQRIGDLLERMRHDGCGGKPQFVELITAIPGASRPLSRIVLIE